MIRTATRLGLWTALLGTLASGCAETGGQTGDEEQAPCWSTITPIALDTESPLGFSPADSLQLAVGQRSAVLHWIPNAQLPYGPESGDGQVQVTIKSLGSARFATHEGAAVTTELTDCAPSVLSDVSVELDSAGGALHETFQAVLVASSESAATIAATLPGNRFTGSFAFDKVALGARTLAQVGVTLSFSGASFSGAINAGIQQTLGSGSNSAVSLQNVPLACWGAAAVPGQAGCGE